MRRINNSVRILEAKITAVVSNNNMTAIQPTDVFRATVGQTESTGIQYSLI